MGRPVHPLRAEFDNVLFAHLARHGEDFARRPLIMSFVDRGVGIATAYRWLEDVLYRHRQAERCGQVASSATLASSAASDTDTVVVPDLPRVPTVADLQRDGEVQVIVRLNECIATAQQVIRHARAPDGSIRNARLLLAGGEILRRAIETAAKLNATVALDREMRDFHRILLDEVMAEPAPVAERILRRIRSVCDEVLANA